MALLITLRYYLKVVTSLENKNGNPKDDPPARQKIKENYQNLDSPTFTKGAALQP